MGAMLSLIRNWLAGLALFVGGTAAVCVALSFAIAGPPTDEEMSAVSSVMDDAIREGGTLAERAAANFCAEIDICEPAQITVAESPITEADFVPPPIPPAPEALPEPSPEPASAAPLLGGQDNTPRVAPRRIEPRRTSRELRARAERARPTPLQPPHRTAIEHLAEREAPPIQDVPAAYQADLGPSEQQQIAQQPADDEAYYDERYADDEGSYDGWEDDWRAERRARREERRRREEERYYEEQNEQASPEEYWPAY